MKKSILAMLIFQGFLEIVSAQGRLGGKILEKINTPQKEQRSLEVKEKDDGALEIKTEDGTLTIQESTSEDAYPNTFLGSFRMDIKNVDRKGKETNATIQYHFSKWKTAVEPKLDDSGDQVKMIFDLQNRKSILLMTDKKGQKSGIITKMNKYSFKSDKLDDKVEQVIEGTTYKRTGETKMIEGYLCEKWVIANDDGETESWITDKVDFNMANAFGFLAAGASVPGAKSTQYKQLENMRGFSLETIHTSKNGEKTFMKITNIREGDVGDAPFSTAGYQLQVMSSLGGVFGK